MSIFNSAKEWPAGMRYPASLRRPELALTDETTGRTRDYTADSNEEYELRLRLVVPYWANKAQHEQAHKAAMRVLAHELHADVLRELPRLRLCIESGDVIGAHEAINRIEEATKP